ncbi:hypothetical protein [Legionella jamestowniensis]|uniref:Uncharacterized protein n=1 Tax=Legionella jamestowniensis TaxID=455 RepID=A0A0W0UJH3_9GAMM|nr:hypothetical protein [Legionella jamestowniensis]KTD07689.1 hypothetical protein Ljam_1884 [Legionella jamestowniensis]OCH99428.1 hypothetical protein A8135_07025 [Legionella jamestowniensis]SFL60691.1 hypothetical protein SAMN02746073_1003 [Legionella jamestowniensis DSM 19215]
MENNERVFAYTSAKVIGQEDLDKVSGGGGSSYLTTQATVAPTGSWPGNFDGRADVTFDW